MADVFGAVSAAKTDFTLIMKVGKKAKESDFVFHIWSLYLLHIIYFASSHLKFKT